LLVGPRRLLRSHHNHRLRHLNLTPPGSSTRLRIRRSVPRPVRPRLQKPQSWSSAYAACESNIVKQCEGGARVGCAMTASENCKPSLWRSLVGGAPTLAELKEREECEQREMEGSTEFRSVGQISVSRLK
ncbi:hypothetical protein LINPERPRIM_LOCUS6207, partial [Linum perenne]